MNINKVDTHIIPFEFEYHSPESLEETVKLLEKYGSEASILAGGTDLLVNMKKRITEPKHLVNIKKIAELNGIVETPEGVRIGATTKLRSIEKSEMVRERLPVLYEAVRLMGSIQVRNMATIGGNLCNASPAADSAIALLALDAKTDIIGQSGLRSIFLSEFFLGPGKTVLRRGEFLTGLSISSLPEGSGSSFLKVGRTSMDIATINIATFLRLRKGVVENCRIALGAVAPIPLRIFRAEDYLKGKAISKDAVEEAAQIVSEDIKPITDLRATAEYRRDVSKALTRDALTISWERAKGRR
ncbi:xanthine dehydrogenase family protein subunit M [Candidatus Bathyarchaeota archaeon]|nr:xanthine dehydrogenase family protein subunit M [Candidatus Bathyarchaeota archaeon]MBS7631438.1 xanthine dehydrogenase family protein subunit M [Candidatus Bathyarchaeota archaeon]